MKTIIIFLSFLFVLQTFTQTNAEKIVWSEKTSDVTQPDPWRLFHSNDDNFYYMSETSKLGLQYILTYDKNNNLISSKLTNFGRKVSKVLKFDDEHIYLVILKLVKEKKKKGEKKKKKYEYYASVFNSITGDIGELKLFNTINEESFSIKGPLEWKNLLYKDKHGWSLSPDSSTYAHILPIDNKDQKGKLKVRISYFNNKLEKIDGQIVEFDFLDKLNDLRKFYLFDDKSVSFIFYTYENKDDVKVFKHLNVFKVDANGDVDGTVIDDEVRSSYMFTRDYNYLFIFFKRFDESSKKFYINSIKVDQNLEIEFEDEFLVSNKRNKWKIHVSETKIYSVHSYFHTYQEAYTSSGKEYYRTLYVYDYFDVIMLDKKTGEQISYNRFKTDGRNYSYLHNDDLYISYRIETDKRFNEKFISDVYFLKVDKYADFSKALISDIELMKNKTKNSYVKWTYFSHINNRFLFKRTMHWDYYFGSIKIDDIKFKYIKFKEFDVNEVYKEK